MKQQFKLGTAGTFVFYPRELEVVSSSTIAIYDANGTEVQASVAATVSAVSTTVSLLAQRGATGFTVVSATGINIGDELIVTGSSGEKMRVTVRMVSGASVSIAGRLTYPLAIGSTVICNKISYALTATHTELLGEDYRAELAYIIGGVTKSGLVTFDVVAVVSTYTTGAHDVIARYPRVGMLLSSGDLDARVLIKTAWDQMLVPRLKAKSLFVERIRDYDSLKPLHLALINELVAEHEASVDSDKSAAYEAARLQSDNMLSVVLSSLDWYDDDQDLKRTQNETKVNFSSTRVSR